MEKETPNTYPSNIEHVQFIEKYQTWCRLLNFIVHCYHNLKPTGFYSEDKCSRKTELLRCKHADFCYCNHYHNFN